MIRGFSISRLSILTCAAWLCAGGAEAHAGDYTACGELVFIPAEGGCFHFTPDEGFFPFGLEVFPTIDHGLRGHVRVSGVLEPDCITTCGLGIPCIVEAVVETCNVPAVSDWGLAMLALLMVVAGTIVIKRRGYKRYSATAAIAVAVFAGVEPVSAQVDARQVAIARSVNRMLDFDHHSENLLVRFKKGATENIRVDLRDGAGGTRSKTFRFVSDLELLRIPDGNIRRALTKLLSSKNVLYAEPDYRVHALDTTPNDPSFDQLWGMNNTGQTGGIAGADIRAARQEKVSGRFVWARNAPWAVKAPTLDSLIGNSPRPYFPISQALTIRKQRLHLLLCVHNVLDRRARVGSTNDGWPGEVGRGKLCKHPG